MATVTLSTLQSRVYNRASASTSDTGLTSSVVTEFINDAIRQVTEEHDWFWLESSANVSVVAGTTAYVLPSAYLRTDAVIRTDTGQPLAIVSRADIYRYHVSNGRPLYYAIDGGNLVIAPTPDAAYTLKHVYIAGETALVNGTDTPLIPDEFSTGIVEYAAFLALRFLRQEERAAEALESYKLWLKRMHDNRIRNREPMRIRIRPGSAL